MEDRITSENVKEKIREIFQSPYVDMNEIIQLVLENLTLDVAGWLIKEIDEYFSDYKLTTQAFMYFYKEMKRAFHDMELDLDDLDSEVLEALNIAEDVEIEEKSIEIVSDSDRREKAIRTVASIYPPDSGHDPTIGRELMWEAMAADWRQLPTIVLEHMAHLNIARDNQ